MARNIPNICLIKSNLVTVLYACVDVYVDFLLLLNYSGFLKGDIKVLLLFITS